MRSLNGMASGSPNFALFGLDGKLSASYRGGDCVEIKKRWIGERLFINVSGAGRETPDEKRLNLRHSGRLPGERYGFSYNMRVSTVSSQSCTKNRKKGKSAMVYEISANSPDSPLVLAVGTNWLIRWTLVGFSAGLTLALT